MTSFLEMFAEVLRTLWSHKLRSFLTMFGIAWGVASLLLLIGLGEGFRSGQRRNMETLGKGLLGWYVGRSATVSPFGAAGSLVALVVWVYYSAQILFLGAEFTQVYATRFGSAIVPTANAVPADAHDERSNPGRTPDP